MICTSCSSWVYLYALFRFQNHTSRDNILRRVELGKTGLSVSRLGLGTDTLFGGVTQKQVTEIILRAWELGINLIDTDHSYGVYPALADALPSIDRSQLVLVTKTYEKTRQGALKDVDRALNTLHVDYVDLFLLHAVDTMEYYADISDALEGLQEAQAKGWIRHIGLSTHVVPVVTAMADHPEIEAILTVLNLTGKNMRRSGSRRAMEQAIERCYAAGQGVYIMKPFARGRLFDDEHDVDLFCPVPRILQWHQRGYCHYFERR